MYTAINASRLSIYSLRFVLFYSTSFCMCYCCWLRAECMDGQFLVVITQ